MEEKLTVAEMSVLHYVNPFCEETISFPNYITIRCDGKEYEILKKLIDKGIIEYSSFEEAVSRHSVNELKEFLKDKGLPISGKKQNLVERIVNASLEREFYNRFPCKYYKPSNIGLNIIKNNPKTNIQYGSFHICIEEIREALNNFDLYLGDTEKVEPYKQFLNLELPFLKFDSTLNTNIKKLVIVFKLKGLRSNFLSDVFFYLFDIAIDKNIFFKTSKFLGSYLTIETAKRISKSFPLNYYTTTCKDERVCETCKAYKDKPISVNNAVIGENCPPFNNCKSDYCRCFIVIE